MKRNFIYFEYSGENLLNLKQAINNQNNIWALTIVSFQENCNWINFDAYRKRECVYSVWSNFFDKFAHLINLNVKHLFLWNEMQLKVIELVFAPNFHPICIHTPQCGFHTSTQFYFKNSTIFHSIVTYLSSYTFFTHTRPHTPSQFEFERTFTCLFCMYFIAHCILFLLYLYAIHYTVQHSTILIYSRKEEWWCTECTPCVCVYRIVHEYWKHIEVTTLEIHRNIIDAQSILTR